MKKSIGVLVLLVTLLGFTQAHAAIITYKIAYTPTVGNVFYGEFTLDESNFAPNTNVDTETFSVSLGAIDWIQGIDAGQTRILLQSDGLASSGIFDGQIFDTAGPNGTNQIFTHNGGTSEFNIRDAQDQIVLSGSFSFDQVAVSAPTTFAVLFFSSLLIIRLRRKA